VHSAYFLSVPSGRNRLPILRKIDSSLELLIKLAPKRLA
jgi:hypothetical protein